LARARALGSDATADGHPSTRNNGTARPSPASRRRYPKLLGDRCSGIGTLSLQPETLIQILLEISDGIVATGFRRLVLLNGHVGNGPALAIAEGKLRTRHPDLQVRAISWWDVSPRVVTEVYADAIEGTLRSFHANDAETSVYLTHTPDLVRFEYAVDEPRDHERPGFSYHSRKLTESGVIGRPTAATVERGHLIIRMAAEDLAEFVRRCAAEAPPDDVWGIVRGI
jgi:creatinine amidohydrolase